MFDLRDPLKERSVCSPFTRTRRIWNHPRSRILIWLFPFLPCSIHYPRQRKLFGKARANIDSICRTVDGEITCCRLEAVVNVVGSHLVQVALAKYTLVFKFDGTIYIITLAMFDIDSYATARKQAMQVTCAKSSPYPHHVFLSIQKKNTLTSTVNAGLKIE